MHQIELALGISIQAPVGVEESRLEELHDRLLGPLLRLVADYPQLILTVSISGPVLAWLAGSRHKSDFASLRELAAQKRLIFALSPYFGPELSLAPPEFIEAELRNAHQQAGELDLPTPTICWLQGIANQTACRQAKALGCTTVIADYFAPDLADGGCEDLTLISSRTALRTAFGTERSLSDTLQLLKRSTNENVHLLFFPIEERFATPPGEAELNTLLIGAVLNSQIRLCSADEVQLKPAVPPVPPDALPLNGPVQARILSRAVETYNRLSAVREHLSVALAPPRELGRIAAAEAQLQQAYRRGLYHERDPERLSLERRDAFRAVISADVELDAVEHPEVDPTTGWITVQTPSDASAGITVDTHLSRFYLDAGANGALTEFDYKPRRYNLIHPAEGCSFSAGLLAVPPTRDRLRSVIQHDRPRANRYLVTRHTRDLLGLRLIDPVAPGTLLIKDYTFKAGIGAYLPNSTTGFQLEYWLEAERPPAGFLALEIALLMPCADPRPLSLRPLLCVGGVSDPLSLTEDHLITHDALPGGCFGARLVDGTSGFFIDLRTAKPLNFLASIAVKGPVGDYLGTTLVLTCEARRIFGDDKPLTLFVSVH